MPRILLQVILSLYLIFAISRVYIRFKSRKLSFFGLVFWSSIFGFGMIGILIPQISGEIAKRLGIGRGADFIVYVSIVILFFLVFRIYTYLEDIKSEIARLVREMSLKHPFKEK